LRDHLSEITGITSPSQVLILCDLTDPDRNRDVLLTGSHDYQSLFECGIRDGSFLTLHPIGISRQLQRNQEEANSQRAIEEEEIDVYSVATTITPAQADHSYNGVVFDIESRGPYETDIISFSFGGMLGRVVVFILIAPLLFELNFSFPLFSSLCLVRESMFVIAHGNRSSITPMGAGDLLDWQQMDGNVLLISCVHLLGIVLLRSMTFLPSLVINIALDQIGASCDYLASWQKSILSS
jgi:hypothetical protein